MLFSELTNDQLTHLAPAVAAENPYHEVSARYDFVPTLAAVNIIRECGWVPIHVEQASVRKKERNGYQKHLIRFRHHLATGSDQERVDLLLFNSHDRGCAFNLIASVFRFICSNGLVIGDECLNFKHKHINFDADAMAGSAFAIADQTAKIVHDVDELKTIELSPNEKGVYALAAHQLLYEDPENAPFHPERLLTEKRYEDEGNDLWNTFNVVQENVMKGGIRGFNRKTRKRTTSRPVKAIDRNIKLNKALWTLTEKMKELKLN